MEIEVIAIGNEILSGFTINTNASYLSQQLLKEGFLVTRHTVLPDQPSLLRHGLSEALKCNQLVITTGGLGPTCDDLTKAIAAELFDSEFYYNEEIALDLKKRYGNYLPSLENQATVPHKAILLKNSVGTAPGFIFEKQQCVLILLPGVPPEMKEMFSAHVLPYIKSRYQNKKRSYGKRIHFFNLPEIAVDPTLRLLQTAHPEISFGIYPSLGILGVDLRVEAESEVSAFAILNKPLHTIIEQFKAYLFTAPSGKLEEAVHQIFSQNKLTLAAAESCTGGAFSSRLTQLSGSSAYFLGSIVAYSNSLKSSLLAVPESLIASKGAVSEEVVHAMWKGLMDKVNSDYAVAITGIAGPTGGSQNKPIGTVWCAVGKRNHPPHIWRLEARGNREMIIERSVNALLAGLLEITRGI